MVMLYVLDFEEGHPAIRPLVSEAIASGIYIHDNVTQRRHLVKVLAALDDVLRCISIASREMPDSSFM